MVLHQESPSIAIGYGSSWRCRPVNILINSFCRTKQGIVAEKFFHGALCTISHATAEVIYVLAQLKYSEMNLKNVKKRKMTDERIYCITISCGNMLRPWKSIFPQSLSDLEISVCIPRFAVTREMFKEAGDNENIPLMEISLRWKVANCPMCLNST